MLRQDLDVCPMLYSSSDFRIKLIKSIAAACLYIIMSVPLKTRYKEQRQHGICHEYLIASVSSARVTYNCLGKVQIFSCIVDPKHKKHIVGLFLSVLMRADAPPKYTLIIYYLANRTSSDLLLFVSFTSFFVIDALRAFPHFVLSKHYEHSQIGLRPFLLLFVCISKRKQVISKLLPCFLSDLLNASFFPVSLYGR